MIDPGYVVTEDANGFTACLIDGIAIAGHGGSAEEATQNLVRFLREIVRERNAQLEKIRSVIDLRLPPLTEDVYEPPPLRPEIPMPVFEFRDL
jgi:hypothetical protein